MIESVEFNDLVVIIMVDRDEKENETMEMANMCSSRVRRTLMIHMLASTPWKVVDERIMVPGELKAICQS